MAHAPVIETQRLRLRSHRPDDLAACLAMWSDPLVYRFIGTASTQQQTWARILAYAGHWNLMGFGYWALELLDSGAFVGEIGLADFRRDIAESMRGVPELGFALASAFHGKGYATEAVRSVLAWADADRTFERTVCLIDARNAASLRIAEKTGYDVFERTTFRGEPTFFLARARATGRER